LAATAVVSVGVSPSFVSVHCGYRGGGGRRGGLYLAAATVGSGELCGDPALHKMLHRAQHFVQPAIEGERLVYQLANTTLYANEWNQTTCKGTSPEPPPIKLIQNHPHYRLRANVAHIRR
jgi:hypothetical protein